MAKTTPQLLAKLAIDKVYTRFQNAVANVAEDLDVDNVDEDVLAGLLHGYADSALEDIAREIANDVIRGGRADGLNEVADEELVWRRSAVLDDNTCDSCDSLDGTEIDGPDDDLSEDCDGGKNCRCIPYAEVP